MLGVLGGGRWVVGLWRWVGGGLVEEVGWWSWWWVVGELEEVVGGWW